MKFIFETYCDKIYPKKILLIDRDGVVIKDTGYPHVKKDIKFMDKNINKLKKLIKTSNFDICGFATNQSGVSRGIFSENIFWSTHRYIIEQCLKKDLEINFTLVNFFKETNYFRKPSAGMLIQAIEFYKVQKKNCMFIGDKDSDRKAAKNASIKFHYIDNI